MVLEGSGGHALSMTSAGRRLGVLKSHLQPVGCDSDVAGCSSDAQLEVETCRAAPPAAVGAPVLVGGMVMDLQVSLSAEPVAGCSQSDVLTTTATHCTPGLPERASAGRCLRMLHLPLPAPTGPPQRPR
jgi:hypothetical protein